MEGAGMKRKDHEDITVHQAAITEGGRCVRAQAGNIEDNLASSSSFL